MTATIADLAPASAGQPHVTILSDRCAGCQECVIRCPSGALSMDESRWIAVADDALCVGCRQCTRTCPFSAITVSGPVAVAERTEPTATAQAATTQAAGTTTEIRPGFASLDEAILEANRCLTCPDPTCVRGCPAHNDIPSFIAAIRDGDLAGAHEVLRRTTVLPDVCSRVCDQSAQCEGSCTWSLAGGTPVSIGKLERFVTDNAPVPPPGVPVPVADAPGAGLSVAVVGSGPAGIGAAWKLIESGASVTVYERSEKPGGLIDWGIPDFTLPGRFARRPWEQLVAAGVDLRCGTGVEPQDMSGLLAMHDAVILAHGAPVPIEPPVPGSDLDGVTSATSFLQDGKAALRHQANLELFAAAYRLPVRDAGAAGPLDEAAPRVLVLGAGNTAMDVARTARRLGLRAVCVDWVDERFAIARPDELAEARHEGVEIRFLRTLARLDGENGRLRRATLTLTRQESSDRKPEPLTGQTETLDVDLVVMAMGYRVNPSFAPLLPGTPRRREAVGLPDRRWLASGILANPAPEFAHRKPVGMLALGRETGLNAALLPYQERVWAAGDAVVGPSTVVEAMAQGKLAASAVIRARPGRAVRRAPSRVLVAYESRGGRTAEAARIIARELRSMDAVVGTMPLSQVGTAELSDTDLLVVGTWVEGLVVARVQPAEATRRWLAGLPRLPGLRTAVFCTYGAAPRGALGALRAGLEDRGAQVLCQDALGPRRSDIEDGAARFAGRLAELAWASAAGQY
ncbi:MAG TPA: FAD-dependent oxidoreductase [Trebonia sp.]|nr:FAD-dependent oxidoreductase [Trebonia sp.]